MDQAQQGKRKPFSMRALVNRSTSRRFQAGTRKNKKGKYVGSFQSDSRG